MISYGPVRDIVRQAAANLKEPQAATMFEASVREVSNMPYPILEVSRSRHVTEGTGMETTVLEIPHAEGDDLSDEHALIIVRAVERLVRLRRRLFSIVDHAVREHRDPMADRGWATGMHAVNIAVCRNLGLDPLIETRPDPALAAMSSDVYDTRCRRGLPTTGSSFLQGDRSRAKMEWANGLQFNEMHEQPRLTCVGQHVPISILQAAAGMPLVKVVGHASFEGLTEAVVVTHAEEGPTGTVFHLNEVVEMPELPPAAADMSWIEIGDFAPYNVKPA